jgi:ABC-type lipoprotein export system ATPase subunit
MNTSRPTTSPTAPMAPLISFQNVSKRFPDGGRQITVLDEVSLTIEAGISVGVYGNRRSGKSTLLRMAAGIVLPDTGIVRFAGKDMSTMSAGERGRLLRDDIAFMSSDDWRAHPGESVLDHVATSLGSEGLTMREARRRAVQILDQVGIGAAGAQEAAASLSLTDRTHAMLARSLAREPRLLVLDEPALMPNLGDRDRFYALLRSAARERDMALLVASEEMAALQGVGVLMSIADGELCSTEERGTVVNLPRRRAAGARPAW